MFATIKSNKGFYIGDPCYVLDDSIYHGIWGNEHNFEDGVIEADGYEFAVFGTAYGDGCYEDGDGNEYGVDSGTISVIPIELLNKSEDELNEEGRYIDGFTADIEYNNGYYSISIGGEEVRIDTTDGDMTDYEDEEDEDYY